MTKLIKYVVLNGIYGYSVYAATMLNSTGWGNIVLFMTVFTFIVAVLSTTDAVREQLVTNKDFGRTMPAQIDMAVTLAFTGMLVYHGWMWTGTMLLVAHLMVSGTIDTVVEMRRKKVVEALTA